MRGGVWGGWGVGGLGGWGVGVLGSWIVGVGGGGGGLGGGWGGLGASVFWRHGFSGGWVPKHLNELRVQGLGFWGLWLKSLRGLEVLV